MTGTSFERRSRRRCSPQDQRPAFWELGCSPQKNPRQTTREPEHIACKRQTTWVVSTLTPDWSYAPNQRPSRLPLVGEGIESISTWRSCVWNTWCCLKRYCCWFAPLWLNHVTICLMVLSILLVNMFYSFQVPWANPRTCLLVQT